MHVSAVVHYVPQSRIAIVHNCLFRKSNIPLTLKLVVLVPQVAIPALHGALVPYFMQILNVTVHKFIF